MDSRINKISQNKLDPIQSPASPASPRNNQLAHQSGLLPNNPNLNPNNFHKLYPKYNPNSRTGSPTAAFQPGRNPTLLFQAKMDVTIDAGLAATATIMNLEDANPHASLPVTFDLLVEGGVRFSTTDPPWYVADPDITHNQIKDSILKTNWEVVDGMTRDLTTGDNTTHRLLRWHLLDSLSTSEESQPTISNDPTTQQLWPSTTRRRDKKKQETFWRKYEKIYECYIIQYLLIKMFCPYLLSFEK